MHRSRGFGKLCVTIGLGLILALSAAAPARAATGLKLAWDANTEPDLAGYRIRYGTAPGTRTQMVDVGNFTSYTVTGLTAGTTYYFAVHAYDLSGNESLPSSEVSGTPVALSPILTLSAADAPDPVAAGANLTYTISYANGGTADATGVVITDTVPANTTFVSATLGGTLSGGVVTWNIGTLPISSSGSVQIVVRVASPLANGTTITNGSYSIDSNETSAVAGTVITTGVTAAPILTLSGTDAPDPVNPGGTLTYTLRYANNGNANATGVVLTDPLPANTTFVSATLGGTQAAGLVTWSLGTLNAGTSGSAQLVVTVAAPLANGTTITNASFGIGSNETAAVGGASIATTVLSGNRFALAQTASPNPVLPGGTVTWTLTYQNLWSTGATGVVITDPVPANTSFVSATAGGTLSGSNVSWTVGSLAASASGSVQMTVRVTSPLADGTVITNSLWSIVSNESTLQTGPAATTTVTSSPLLSLSASDAPDPVSAGSNLTYTLTYRNGGTANATGVVIADTLPANTIFVSATSGGTLSGSAVTWSLGALNASASGSVQMVVRVASPLANGTTITHASYSIDCAETAAVAGAAVTTTVMSSAILSLSAVDAPDPVVAGSNLTYTISYANGGNANATGAVIADTLPANTTFVSATSGGTLSGSVVTWSLGALNASASGTVQMVVRVASPLANGTTITNGSYSIDCNETPALSGAPVTTGVIGAVPTIATVVEMMTSSIYILRGKTSDIRVTGANFLPGAAVNLSADISAGPTTLAGSTSLSDTLQVASTATLGARTLTLTNPDGGSARLASALTVVMSPDLNGDCLVDGTDLNLIALAWNTTSGQAAYNAAADLDGDNYVGPIDLTIFTKYFGRRLAGCP